MLVTRQLTSLQLFQKPVKENMEYNRIAIVFPLNHSIPLKRYASIITRHHLSWTFNIFIRSKHNATLAHFTDTHIIFAYTHDLHVHLFLPGTCKAPKRISTYRIYCNLIRKSAVLFDLNARHGDDQSPGQ